MIYSQYSQAHNLINLIDDLSNYLNINKDDFIKNYFDLKTCNTQGLDNWGLILNTSRYINVVDINSIFGFDTGSPANPLSTGYPQNFNNGVFFDKVAQKQGLTDEAYRLYLLFTYKKYVFQISISSCLEIVNLYCKTLNENYKCKIVEDTQSLSFIYEFNYELSALEITLFKYLKILPKPCGVEYTINYLGYENVK